MLIDTHGHLNMMVKQQFDVPLNPQLMPIAKGFMDEAQQNGVEIIINVGTSLVESKNCISLAQQISSIWATVGIHPNDCTNNWRSDFEKIKQLTRDAQNNKIVGIGECGMDKHYPDYNLSRQKDAFKAQIELALEHDLALVVHSRDAYDETLNVLQEYKNDIQRGIIHCFSYDHAFAQEAINMNFALGIGGTITYPKNETLRTVLQTVGLETIVLETDAPFLPPQIIRGKQNHPKHIKTIAEFIATLLKQPVEQVAKITTKNALKIFKLESHDPKRNS